MAEEIDLSPAEEAALERAWARVGPLLAPGRDAPFAVTGPDLSGLGDLLSLTRQEVLDALFDAALDSFDLALPDAGFAAPDQPRVPAGQSGGGEWTSGGVGGGGHLDRPLGPGYGGRTARGELQLVHGATEERPPVGAFVTPVRLAVEKRLRALAEAAGARGRPLYVPDRYLTILDGPDSEVRVQTNPGSGHGRVWVWSHSSHGPDPTQPGLSVITKDTPPEEVEYRLRQALGLKVSRAEAAKYRGQDRAARAAYRQRRAAWRAANPRVPDAEFSAGPDVDFDPDACAPFYSPDQPRLPEGQAGGGEWTSGGGGGPPVSPVPPTALARYYHSLLGYIADNGPAPAGELSGHLGDRHRLGAAKARAVVEHLARQGDLARGTDEYGRGVLGPKGSVVGPAPLPAAANPEAHVLDFAARASQYPGGLAPVWELGRQLGLPPDDLKALLFRLSREDKIRLIAVGDRSRLTHEQLRDSVQGENETFAYIEPGPDHPAAAFSLDAPFYSPDQPRDELGRWTSGGGTAERPGFSPAQHRERRQAAADAVRDFARGQGPPTAAEVTLLAGHLARLTVAGLHALKAEHGLKGSAPNKGALVAKLAERFRAWRGGRAPKEAVPDWPADYDVFGKRDVFADEPHDAGTLAPAVPAQPFMIGMPIADRLKAYTGADHVAAVAARGKADLDAARGVAREARHLHDSLARQVAWRMGLQDRALANGDDANYRRHAKALKPLFEKTVQAGKEWEDGDRGVLRLKRKMRDEVNKALAAPPGSRITWKQLHFNLTPAQQADAEVARDWVQSVLHRVAGDMPDLPSLAHGPVEKSIDPEARAHFSRPGGTYSNVIRTEPRDNRETHVHELGHYLENNVPGVGSAARAFLEHRVGSETPQSLKALFPDSRYKDYEYGREDDFGKLFGKGSSSAYYAGKVYGSGDTELVSMGLEQLYKDPADFFEKDPEWAKFIVGILQGPLRD